MAPRIRTRTRKEPLVPPKKPLPIVRRGEAWLVNFDPVVGRERAGTRPALVLSADALNEKDLDIVTVLPITSRKRALNLRVELVPPEAGLRLTSYVITEQIRTISKHRLSKRLGPVHAKSLAKVEDAVRIFLDL